MKAHFSRNADAYVDSLIYFTILAGNAYLGGIGKMSDAEIAGLSVHGWFQALANFVVTLAVAAHAYRRYRRKPAEPGVTQ